LPDEANRCDSASRGFIAGGVPAWTLTRRAAGLALCLSLAECTSIDPGSDFVVPNATFDPNYFYCVVEPQYLVLNNCGTGDPAKGDPPNGCHYNSSAVSGMALLQPPTIPCSGGQPTDPTLVADGTAAAQNYSAASLEMNSDYTTAPIYVRPSGNSHPRQVIPNGDTMAQMILATWAASN
jgi:hypothetical protein